jgi:hypothetical protein
MLPDINEQQADFVLGFAKKDGLSSLVRKLDLDDEKENLIADLQPELIQAFSNKFPEADLSELDNVVTWIILKSATRMGK